MCHSIPNTLHKVNNGSRKAYKQLFSVTYHELLTIAERMMRYEKKDHSYSGTDLLHEVFLDMVNMNQITWKNADHFYGVTAICMRQLLIDYARKENAQKRGGQLKKTEFIEEIIPAESSRDEKKDLKKALKQLRKFDQRMAEVVDLRFFKGYTIRETAVELGVSRNTVNRDWAKARGILYKILDS